jgi:predicted nucleotidyltransferase
MLTKKEIFQTIIDHKDEIKSFGVTEIGLFGSYVRNEQTEESDIDILVDIIKEKKTLKNYIDFCDLLENLFKNKKIDIVSKKGLSEFIGPHILKEVDYVKIG